jgi:hypothetical protein
MKRQLRPYRVEIKSSRPRPPSSSAPARSAQQDIDLFPEDLPVRDVREDLAEALRDPYSAKSGALQEAERLFAGLTAQRSEPSSTLGRDPAPRPLISAPDAQGDARQPSTPEGEVRRPRVLPDLREQAHPHKFPAATEPVRPTSVERSSTRPSKRRSRPPAAAEEPAPSVPSLEPLAVAAVEGERLLPRASASLVHSRLPRAGMPGVQQQTRRRASGQLPRSERWKTRRLPRVCWAKPRGFWSQDRT